MANDILAARTKYVAEMFPGRNSAGTVSDCIMWRERNAWAEMYAGDSAGLKLAYRWAIRREIAKIRELRRPQKG